VSLCSWEVDPSREFVVQFVAGVGEVLKQFHFLVKVNEKSLVCLLGALGSRAA